MKGPSDDKKGRDNASLKAVQEAFRLFEESAGRGRLVNKDLKKNGRAAGKKDKAAPAELDLHGLRLDEALQKAGAFLKEAELKGAAGVRVITGRGRHTEGVVSPLKSGLEDYLLERGYRFKKTDGAFEICLKKG